MSDFPRPIGEDDLQAFVDGRLSLERRPAVADYLDRHPEAAARVAAYARQRLLLKEALKTKSEEPVPMRLRADHILHASGRRRERFRTIAASIVLAAGVGAAGGWFGRGLADRDDAAEGRTALAVGAHRVFVADKRRPVEIRAEAQDQLVQWLSNRLERPVAIPDLGGVGLRFMGGRLIATPAGPAAQLMYDDDAGVRVTLFIEPGRPAPSEPIYAKIDDVAALSWSERGSAYTVSAQSGRDWVTAVAALIRRRNPSG